MDNAEIQRKCEEFLETLGIPGFVFFGWKKPDNQFGFVYSYRQFPRNIGIQGLEWALKELRTAESQGTEETPSGGEAA
ncbi:MAG: hypothetical protein Q7R81_07135 [Candidatus Peregrinibacteria bacterium]|nr:hypothetical protein [Candidatus Peregrinibacteria bacterium]